MIRTRRLITILIFLTSLFTLHAEKFCDGIIVEQVYPDTKSGFVNASFQTVYICTGEYAYAYHSNNTCAGLNNCKGEIKYTDENTAISIGRRPCCRCWSYTTGCKDDNSTNASSSGGGSGGGVDYTVVALIVVVTAGAILSNDFYFYPVFSSYKHSMKNGYNTQESTDGNGVLFGLRKTFKHSALEYGFSSIKTESVYTGAYNPDYENLETRVGVHLNYAQQIFYNQTPQWLKIYLGPTINGVYEFGYGGFIGTEMKLFNRLKFDIRYEYTTQTKQIQAGLIFTYQKKYFWKK